MKNKHLVILLLGLINIAVSSEKDSIFMNIEPDTLYCGISDTIYCNITNNGADTLVFINEFYAYGINENIIGFPMGYCPNILFFKKTGHFQLVGDGVYRISYSNVPALGIITPHSTITVKITYKNNHPLLTQENWQTSSVILVARKRDLDSVIYRYYKDRLSEYYDSFQFFDTYYFELKNKLPDESIDENESLDIIKDVFTIALQDFRI